MNIKVTVVDLGYELNNCLEGGEGDLVRQYYRRVTGKELELMQNTQSLLHIDDLCGYECNCPGWDESLCKCLDECTCPGRWDESLCKCQDEIYTPLTFVRRLKSEQHPHYQGPEPPYERSYVFVLHSCDG